MRTGFVLVGIIGEKIKTILCTINYSSLVGMILKFIIFINNAYQLKNSRTQNVVYYVGSKIDKLVKVKIDKSLVKVKIFK